MNKAEKKALEKANQIIGNLGVKPEPEKTHVRYIVVGGSAGGGTFGMGETLSDAMAQYREAGGKSKEEIEMRLHGGWSIKAWKFKSNLPFAPTSREAEEDEADAWVDSIGRINWIRCEKEVIEV